MSLTLTLLSGMLIFACTPDTQDPVCMEKYAWVGLSARNLNNHHGFDWFDTALRGGQAIWDGYDTVLKVAPDNVLARVRAAWALWFMGPKHKGPSQALALLKDLRKQHPENTDVQFLDLAIGIQQALQQGTGRDTDALAQRVRAFNAAHPSYIGPHGITAKILLRSLTARGTGAGGTG